MNEALRSVLCDQDQWYFDVYVREFIKFKKDGTGEVCTDQKPQHQITKCPRARKLTVWNEKLWCLRDSMYILAVNIDWKSLPLPKTDESIETAGIKTSWSRKPQVLGKMNLEIKLNTSVAKSLVGPLPNWPSPDEHYLSEAAFEPRTFTVTIEKGNFAPKHLVGCEGDYRHRYSLRLLFDRSPYPTREGFETPDESPVSDLNFDEMDMFVARSLPQSETKGKAMNDDSPGSGRGCTIG